MYTMLDSKVYKNINNAKDASTHTAEIEMLKSGKENGALVSITISQVDLMQPRYSTEPRSKITGLSI